MDFRIVTCCAFGALAASIASAHGPQIQVTDTNNKITIRNLILNEPYSGSLTGEKTVYVLPIQKAESGSPTTDYWTVMPNNTIDPILNTSEYQFGPGLAYGFGQTFATGFHFNVNFTDSLKFWNGTAFINNPGPEAVGAFRGDSTSSPDQVIVTGGSTPSQSLAFSNIVAGYISDSHSSMRFRMLGDGASALVAPPDGIYMLKLQVTSTQPGLDASNVLSFLLYKNVSSAAISAAVSSLGVDSSLVQIVAVPEPTAMFLALIGGCGFALRRQSRSRNRA